ncbi:hypothetical protein BYI23_A009380 [Burkholderia sp. YI23]|nr:hypothetical protein BYI23_A009380 [Burkholderia sp. YI23]
MGTGRTAEALSFERWVEIQCHRLGMHLCRTTLRYGCVSVVRRRSSPVVQWMLAGNIDMQNVMRVTALQKSNENVLAHAGRVRDSRNESITRTIDTKYSRWCASTERMLCTAMANARGNHAGHRISSAWRRQ